MSAGPGALVSLADRRDQVVSILAEQYGGSRIELEELERRMQLAHQATSVATLDALVADLVAAPAARPAVTALDHPARGRVVAMFGGVDKGGPWTVPRKLTVIASFGGADIDLREARFAPGVTEIRVYCAFGGVDLVVPPGLEVQADAIAIFGGVDANTPAAGADPDRSIVRLTGFAAFGGVGVEVRLPGESRRDAKRRKKAEAKALGGRGAAALPPATARIKSED